MSDDFPDARELESPFDTAEARTRHDFLHRRFNGRRVVEDETGRRRPIDWQLPKQDPADCKAARDAMRPEPGSMQECSECHVTWPVADMTDHPCFPPFEPPPVAGNGSVSFANISEQRRNEGLIGRE